MLKNLLVIGISSLIFTGIVSAKETNKTYQIAENQIDNIHNIKVQDMDGKFISLSSYKGKVLLIVNVASQCGYTPQYDGLENLYKKYNKKGLEILAFPSNDFGGQEPGSNEEIKQFCKKNFGVTFKLFDKVPVSGKNKIPLYEKLTNNNITSKEEIDWNFEKFVISKDGKIIKRFKSAVRPENKELVKTIESELSKKI